MSDVVTLVTCSKCKVEKPSSDFRRCASKKNGLASYCRTCANTELGRWRREHADLARERNKTYQRRYRSNHPYTSDVYLVRGVYMPRTLLDAVKARQRMLADAGVTVSINALILAAISQEFAPKDGPS